jgi:hypothetical protein
MADRLNGRRDEAAKDDGVAVTRSTPEKDPTMQMSFWRQVLCEDQFIAVPRNQFGVSHVQATIAGGSTAANRDAGPVLPLLSDAPRSVELVL